MSEKPIGRRDALVAGAGMGAMLLPGVAATAGKVPAVAIAAPLAAPAGRDQPFDEAWLFRHGEGAGLEAPELDDSAWRRLDLPHDWSIEDLPGGGAPDRIGPFDRQAIGAGATGFTLGGEGWYRKRFRIDHLPADARILVEFDGVSVECAAWINGAALGRRDHGYAPFWFDLTEHMVRGRDNVLAVRVRNLGRNSRWYAGSGLYRQVRLHVVPHGTRIAQWGVAAWTRRIADGAAEIDVTTEIVQAEPGATVVTRLRDAAGRVVAEARAPAEAKVRHTLRVRGARLWSIADPYLYSLESEVHRGGVAVDRQSQAFGLRIIAMDAKRGLTMNGTRVVLRGGCIHHDNGLLGACAFIDADARRLRLLKARGYNAIRSAHNPASRSLREACDRIGLLLIEEAFDMWHVAKLPDDHAQHFAADWRDVVAAMVRSARNSPSVFLWSIGNEIPGRTTTEGVHWEWQLANTVRRIDPTRPVTAALHGVLGPVLRASMKASVPGRANRPDNASTIFLDVAGYNYRLDDFERDHAAHPERIMYASETFPRDAWDYVRLTARAPYVLGEFVWTALDYIGEAAVGGTTILPAGAAPSQPGWPWVIAWCGDLDLIGDQKAPSLFRDVAWGLSKLEMAVHRPLPEGSGEFVSPWGWPDVVPSWTWPGMEGRPMVVHLYTPGDRVELWLNGARAGEARLAAADGLRAEISLPYAVGRLEAVAFRAGREIGRRRLDTVSAAAALRVTPERRVRDRGRQALCYVGIEVVDRDGRRIPDAALPIGLTIDGPAELAGFGSGDPFAAGSFQSGQVRSFRGRALAILRSTGRSGVVTVAATGETLAGGSATIQFR